jgi:hypothetical protein
MDVCTIAESITVNYNIQVAPEINPSGQAVLMGFVPITGTLTTSVKEIFGNDPR